MINYYCRLQHGSRYIDLTTAPFCVDQDWRPPGADVIPLMTSGTMANQYAGGELVYEQYVDRSMIVPLNITGSSKSETHNAIGIFDSFVSTSLADKSEKLYLVYGPSNAVPYTPKWGQQFYKYEIKANLSGSLGAIYGTANTNANYINFNVHFMVAPVAVGERQRVGSATGGIFENTIGTANGSSRGLCIPDSTTNLVTNPIFGHATYDNDWTTGADLRSSKNTDKNFVMFGESSAKLTSIGATNRYFRISVTAADTSSHTFSLYAKLPDSGAISDSIIHFYYGGNVTETYTPVGNGWYRIVATAAGVAAPTNYDVIVVAPYTVFIDGVQFEDNNFASPLCHGNMLDCAWTGTAHDSTTTRTEARYRVPASEIIEPAQGTIRIAWIAGRDSSSTSAEHQFFDGTTASEFMGYYFHTNGNYHFTVGANNISSSAIAFSTGDLIVLHYVWGPGTMKIYRNGTQIATGTSFDPPTLGDYLYIGSNDGGTLPSWGTYSNFITWGVDFTAAEVLADYTDFYQHFSGGDGYGQAINPIPWLWTDDGDDTVDNCYNVADTLDGYSVVSGVPGNIKALTEWKITPDEGAGAFSHDVYFGNIVTNYLYFDKFNNSWLKNGTGTADAAASENTCLAIATASTTRELGFTPTWYDKIEGEIHFFCRVRMASGTESLGVRTAIVSSYGTAFSPYKTISVGATYEWHSLGSMNVKSPEFTGVGLTCYVQFNTGNTADIHLDYIYCINGNLLKADLGGAAAVNGSAPPVNPVYIIIKNKEAIISPSASNQIDIIGSSINLSPNSMNTLVATVGDDSGTFDMTDTIAYTYIYVTPRWTIL